MEIYKIRTRNWQKARLLGFSLDTTVLTEDEKAAYQRMLEIKNTLLLHWDTCTEELIGHALPPHKCEFCGKRSTVAYELDGHNYCSKHFNAFKDE